MDRREFFRTAEQAAAFFLLSKYGSPQPEAAEVVSERHAFDPRMVTIEIRAPRTGELRGTFTNTAWLDGAATWGQPR